MKIRHLQLFLFLQIICLNSFVTNELFAQTENSFENIFIFKEIDLDGITVVQESLGWAKISIVKKGNYYGLINSQNQLLLPIEYDSIEYPRLAFYFFITKDKLKGVVTDEGILTVPIIYEHIEEDFKDDLSEWCMGFIVQKNKKLGSIDLQNNIVIPIEYDGISNWVEYGPDAHYVKSGDLYGLINYNTGELIIPPIYEGILVHQTNLVEVSYNDYYGVIDYQNNAIIPCLYNSINVDLNWMGLKKNFKELIYTKSENYEFTFELSGKLVNKKQLKKNDRKKHSEKFKLEEYGYHLIDCMIFPK